jgi:hypothetical protein
MSNTRSVLIASPGVAVEKRGDELVSSYFWETPFRRSLSALLSQSLSHPIQQHIRSFDSEQHVHDNETMSLRL